MIHRTALFLFSAFIVAVLLAFCTPGTELAEPSIELEPAAGGPGTAVTIAGVDFPAGTAVSVRLGPPDVGASPQSYGEAVTNEVGVFDLAFVMPAEWPDGTSIDQETLTVAIINEDASVKATAFFAFQPAIGQVPIAGGTTAGEITVESIEIQAAEASPLQITLVARGYLPDSCTVIDRITQKWVNQVLQVTIHTLRSDDVLCAQALVSMEKTIVVDTEGMLAGRYTGECERRQHGFLHRRHGDGASGAGGDRDRGDRTHFIALVSYPG